MQAITPEEPGSAPPASYGSYSCTPGVGTPPPDKLVLHADQGIRGEYIVLLLDTVPDAGAAARSLASKYGGSVRYVYTFALHGFSISLDDAKAPLLAADPLVCVVEQDVPVHMTVR